MRSQQPPVLPSRHENAPLFTSSGRDWTSPGHVGRTFAGARLTSARFLPRFKPNVAGRAQKQAPPTARPEEEFILFPDVCKNRPT